MKMPTAKGGRGFGGSPLQTLPGVGALPMTSHQTPSHKDVLRKQAVV